ncbi:MAG: flagellar hook-basal body complex protein, partial [Lachnospiraceae bacterium]|nr:flagellar hook-basal body complex protein [Lachnospiraceae bacterium]
MMRALYSGVSGLKTHQTKMDVIGNNIANVNTTAYKSQSVTFSELMYQTTQAASGPNATTGTAGLNAKQIGLGSVSGAISTAITTPGSSQTTGNPFDLKITGDSFFIVNNGKDNYFTRDGSFYVDAAGNLATTSTGYNVMGWGVEEATGNIKQDVVQPLRIMSPENMTYPPEATSKAYVSGILDKNDSNAASSAGKTISVSIFDGLGYAYTVKFAIKNTESEGVYNVEMTDILNSNNESLKDVYKVGSIKDIANFGSEIKNETTAMYTPLEGVTYDPAQDKFYKVTGLSVTFSDFDDKKLPGIDYKVPASVAASQPQTLAANSSFTLEGSGTLSKDDLEEAFGLIYVKGGDATHAYDYYYYKDDTNEYFLGESGHDQEWQDVLGKGNLTGFGIQMTGEGEVTFNFTQDFTVDTNTIYNNDKFTKELAT